MNTQELGLEPLMGVEELAEYLGVPVQTIYDWRVAGTAPRAFSSASDSSSPSPTRGRGRPSTRRPPMTRQRLPIGTHGAMTVMNLPDGRVEVRTRYRDFDGKSRLVSARANSKSAAEAALRKRLAERHLYQPVDTTLSLDSLFGELVDYWLADIDLEGRIAASTRRGYEDAMRTLVMPAFEHLTLREIGVAWCDALLKQLGQKSYARSKRAKTVMRLAFGLAVRHEVIGRNPIDGVARLYKPKRTPTAGLRPRSTPFVG